MGSTFENLLDLSFHNEAGSTFTNAGTVRNSNGPERRGFFDNKDGAVFRNLNGLVENGYGMFFNSPNAGIVNTGTIDTGSGTFINDGVIENYNGASITGEIYGPGAQEINNDPPIAENQQIQLLFNTLVEIIPQATDPEGQELTYSFVGSPDNGRLLTSNSGRFIYAPNLNFSGEDTLYLMASDGVIDSNIAAIRINVYKQEKIFSDGFE